MTDITQELEAMIDRHGLLHVLTGLDLICSEKAEFLRATRDKHAAHDWQRASNSLYTAARHVAELEI